MSALASTLPSRTRYASLSWTNAKSREYPGLCGLYDAIGFTCPLSPRGSRLARVITQKYALNGHDGRLTRVHRERSGVRSREDELHGRPRRDVCVAEHVLERAGELVDEGTVDDCLDYAWCVGKEFV